MIRLIPPGNYVTVEPAYQVMASMCGQPMPAEDAERLATMAGWYNKTRCPPNCGHWFRVVEVGPKVSTVSTGDYVVADIHVRDHRIDFPSQRGLHHLHSKHLCGVLKESEGGQYQYTSLGYWSLVQRDPKVASKVQGTKRIILVGESTTHGVLSGDSFGDSHELRDVQPGIRVIYARMIDPSGANESDAPKGSVIAFQNMGFISTPLAGVVHDSVADGAVLGVVESDEFEAWEEPKPLDKPPVLE